MNPMDLLLNPEEVGQSEYRAIHDCIKDGLEDVPDGEKMDLAMAMLKELKGWAKSMRKTLKKASSKKASRKG